MHLAHPSVTLSVPYKTKKRRKIEIDITIHQVTSKWSGSFRLKTSKASRNSCISSVHVYLWPADQVLVAHWALPTVMPNSL